jgi:hypothetical protein
LTENPGLAVLSLCLLLTAGLILVGLILGHSLERLKRRQPLPSDEPPTPLAQAVESLTSQRDAAQTALMEAHDCEDAKKAQAMEAELTRLDGLVRDVLGAGGPK